MRLKRVFFVAFLAALVSEAEFCPNGWLPYKDKCLTVLSTNFTRSLAGEACTYEASDVASLATVQIYNFVDKNFGNSTPFWVGMHVTEHGIRWIDGQEINQDWVSMQIQRDSIMEDVPEDFIHSKVCAVFTGEIVNLTPCTDQHWVLCSRQKPRFDPKENCKEGLTEHSFIGAVSGDCIYRTPDSFQQGEAESKCRESGGQFLDLLDVIVEGITAFLQYKVMTDDGWTYWTGMQSNGSHAYWRNTVFEIDQQVVEGSGLCVQFSINFSEPSLEHLMLHNADCDSYAHALCASSSHQTTTIKTTTTTEVATTTVSRPMYCPRGLNWKTYSVTNACYWETSFETSRLNFDEAQEYCQQFGGNLASFHSIDEEKIGLSFQYGSLKHPYWIGLEFDIITQTYKWLDGTPLDYENWAPGHPNHRDKQLRCVAMDGHAKHWISTLCGINSWFICKVNRVPEPKQVVTPTRVPLSPCRIKDSKSFYYEGYCYQAVNRQFTWHRANQYCENEGGKLASLHSYDEIAFILRLLYDDKHGVGNRRWIGLNSFRSRNYRWSDSSPVDMTYWSENEPNEYLNQEKCCNMYVGNGSWNDENCNSMMGFICKWFKDAPVVVPVSTAVSPSEGNCKNGWLANGENCFYAVGLTKKEKGENWTQASKRCQEYGGQLASIHNEKDQAFLTYVLQSLKSDAWIGLHDTIESGRYYWTDNSDIQFTNWALGEPSYLGIEEDCVYMAYNDADSGSWKDGLCVTKLPFICQTEKDPTLPKQAFNRDTDCMYPEGWLKLDGSCFSIFTGHQLSWKEAEDSCQKHGAHLVSITSASVFAVVTHLSLEVNQTFWTGMQQKGPDQKLEWINGWPMQISKWGANEPGIYKENMCFYSSVDESWRRKSCDTQMPYVCQITTGKPPTVKVYSGDCPKASDLWIKAEGSFCYSYTKVQQFSTLACAAQGAMPASFHSMQDLEIVKRTFKPEVTSFFIGMLQHGCCNYAYYWLDGSPVDFVNWEFDPSEDEDNICVIMMANSLKWRKTTCSSAGYVICAAKKDQVNEVLPEIAKLTQGTKLAISTAAITAILVCSFLLVAIIVVAIIFRPKLGKSRFRNPFRQHSMSFENALYNADSASLQFQEDR